MAFRTTPQFKDPGETISPNDFRRETNVFQLGLILQGEELEIAAAEKAQNRTFNTNEKFLVFAKDFGIDPKTLVRTFEGRGTGGIAGGLKQKTQQFADQGEAADFIRAGLDERDQRFITHGASFKPTTETRRLKDKVFSPIGTLTLRTLAAGEAAVGVPSFGKERTRFFESQVARKFARFTNVSEQLKAQEGDRARTRANFLANRSTILTGGAPPPRPSFSAEARQQQRRTLLTLTKPRSLQDENLLGSGLSLG